MPDIELRFHKDLLVLSAPLDAALARQGIDAARDRQYLNLMEPDVVADALRMEQVAGAQCLVATTEDLTQARLAHVRMEGDAARLAHAAVLIAADLKPQHLIAEIGPCGLPLDPSSKSSLNENRKQYADAARILADEQVEAILVNGFTSLDDLKCALMGVRQVCDLPVFASVAVGETPTARGGAPAPLAPTTVESALGNLGAQAAFGGYELLDDAPFAGALPQAAPLSAEALPEAVAVMEDLGASVAGFETADPAFKAEAYARQAAAATSLPLLAQLNVTKEAKPNQPAPLVPLEDILDYTPDTIATAAVKLYGAGVQFVRATGLATPSFTGALAATLHGLDARAR